MTCSWYEAAMLEVALTQDTATAYGAAVAGFVWPASPEAISGSVLAQAILSWLSEAGKQVKLPMPWDRDPAPPPQDVVDEMRARLQKYSAFGAD